jgi:putative NADH-flavin reductase
MKVLRQTDSHLVSNLIHPNISSRTGKGADVVSINRSGAPLLKDEVLKSSPKWVKADLFEPDTWRKELEGADAVVSCIGAFGSNEVKKKGNVSLHCVIQLCLFSFVEQVYGEDQRRWEHSRCQRSSQSR